MTTTPQQQQESPWRIDTWFPNMDEGTRGQLKIFFDEMMKFGRALHLVSPKTFPFTDIIHFADCVLASELIRKDNPRIPEIYDIGTGNGFPGLIFAAMNHNTKVRIVDADERKGEFLKNTAALMGLKNVIIMPTHVDKLGQESIQYCIARGWGSLSKAILVTLRLVKEGGEFYHMKTDGWAAEVSDIPTQLCSSWTPSLVGEYNLPMGPNKFAVVKTTKIQGR